MVAAERGLSSALDAFPSVLAPVWAVVPAWRNAEAANVRWITFEDSFPRVLPASEATLGEVFFVLEVTVNTPKGWSKRHCMPRQLHYR